VSNYDYHQISRMIDHSLLRPASTIDEFEQGCRLAVTYQTGSVCIQPHYLARCAELLKESGVHPSTVIGFPHGGHSTSVKVAEARQALLDGGEELDLVCNISRVVSGDWDYVTTDLRAVIELTHDAGQKVKVIFENCYLTDAQKIRLCEICTELQADWVKTSTGYGTSGSTFADLQLMRQSSGPAVQIKAAGGIRDLDGVLKCRELGISRVGASATQAILDECRRRLNLPALAVTGPVTSAGY